MDQDQVVDINGGSHLDPKAIARVWQGTKQYIGKAAFPILAATTATKATFLPIDRHEVYNQLQQAGNRKQEELHQQ